MNIKKIWLSILQSLTLLLVVFVIHGFGQSAGDYHKVEIFGGYSLAATKTITESVTFTSPGGSQTFSDLCSSATGEMIGGNLQKFFCDRRSFNGFDASITFNLSKYFGIKGDFTGHFKDDRFDDNFTPPGVTQTITTRERLYNFLVGVQVKNNSKEAQIKPFAHALIGAARYTDRQAQVLDLFPQFNFDGQDRETSFAMKLGGGIDIRAGKRIDVRVFEIDYHPIFAGDRNWKVISGPFNPISSTGRRSDNITFSFGIVIH
ncbi:MAG: hypothetical protein AB1757_18710 [Acidobacteriota bacterium]